MLPFTSAELADAVIDGRVTARRHPSLHYTIFNYSPEVQYSNHWDDVTLNCRGLILDDNFEIIARPWRKFFNLGQVDLPIQFDTPVEIMDKVDGSLGILYPDLPGIVGKFSIATRGSFESEQAQHATFVWKMRYEDYYNDPAESEVLKDYTILFEIVYPSNRIVLDYQDMDDLVILGAVEKETGYYVGPTAAANMIAWPGPVVEVMPYKTLSDALGHMERPNAEGYVIRSHNFMVKLKQPDYLELHKLVTNASPKTVWEQLRAGKSKEQIISAFPDEFHTYIGSMIDPLLEKFDARGQEIFENWSKLIDTLYDTKPTRKDYALLFKGHRDAKYYFLLLDDKPIRDVLWTELKPKESVVEQSESRV